MRWAWGWPTEGSRRSSTRRVGVVGCEVVDLFLGGFDLSLLPSVLPSQISCAQATRFLVFTQSGQGDRATLSVSRVAVCNPPPPPPSPNRESS